MAAEPRGDEDFMAAALREGLGCYGLVMQARAVPCDAI